MIVALDNLIFLCVGFTVIWATWLILPVIYNFVVWTLKGVFSIIKACPRGVMNAPFFSLLFVLFAVSYPYFALSVLLAFAVMLGDLGEDDTEKGA